MRLMSGIEEVDSGRVTHHGGLRFGHLMQVDEFDPELTIREVIFGTDWPVIPFDRAVNETKELGLSAEASEHLFALNTQRIYGLD